MNGTMKAYSLQLPHRKETWLKKLTNAMPDRVRALLDINAYWGGWA